MLKTQLLHASQAPPNTNKHLLFARILMCFAVLLSVSSLHADTLEYPMPMVLAVHQDNDVSQLEKKDVIDIYMGRFSTFPNGKSVRPIDFPVNSIERSTFYQVLVGKTERKIDAYWSRLLFSGRATPPVEADSKEEVIELLSESTIIYLHKGDVTEEMKIVYQL